MNATIEAFARGKLKELLYALPSENKRIFSLMYSHKNPDLTMDDVVDRMPCEKLDWALTQVENTIKKVAQS